MSDDVDDREIFFNRRPDKTIWSRSLSDLGDGSRRTRIVSKVVDGSEGLQFATIKDEVVLRVTAAQRFCIKATILEDDRAIKTLSIQKYSSKTGPLKSEHFSFVGDEIDTLLQFVAALRATSLPNPQKFHVHDNAVREVLDDAEAQRLFKANQGLFREIAQREELQRDLIAVGYRRAQLRRFETLLADPELFKVECERLSKTPEGLWQAFFEANTWIFGYGLAYQFMTGLDNRTLEQVVRSADLTGPGKRSDALLKTQGAISSLGFVEIKRHDTLLMTSHKPFRSGAWSVSSELAGGIAQIHATVAEALEQIGRKLMPTDANGNPTGEILFNVQPRSFLIIGNLDEFITEHGINEQRFRSFETFRRSLGFPEILTFDEFLNRARFIVDHNNPTGE